MKSYTDLNQSKKLAEFLPFKSADMTLPFRHTLKNEYIPGHVVSRNYIDVYNEMLALPGMDKEEVCKLIQPVWSLAALFEQISSDIKTKDGCNYTLEIEKCDTEPFTYGLNYHDTWRRGEDIITYYYDNFVDACYELILKLHELNLL